MDDFVGRYCRRVGIERPAVLNAMEPRYRDACWWDLKYRHEVSIAKIAEMFGVFVGGVFDGLDRVHEVVKAAKGGDEKAIREAVELGVDGWVVVCNAAAGATDET